MGARGVAAVVLLLSAASAFPSPPRVRFFFAGPLAARERFPEYDAQAARWSEGSDGAGYGATGSLIRQGPVAFLSRVRDPDSYEQGVRKYMAQERCSRMEAQGNFDAFLANPNDWVLQKLAEKKGGPKRDYANANMNPKSLTLTAAWVVIVSSYLANIFAPYIIK